MYKKDSLNLQNNDWIYTVLLFPLFLLFLLFSISTYYLLFFKHLSKFVFIFSYIAAELILFLLNPKKIIQSFLFSTFILFITIYSTTFVYDYTWDGNDYHKLCAGLIKEGWNPVKETIITAIERADILPTGTASAPFYDGYPKASYLIAATIYSFTGNIETGKAYTLLVLITAIAIVFTASKTVLKTTTIGSLLIAFSLCCNPVVFSQIYSFYNDALLQLLFFIVCAELLIISNQDSGNITLNHFLVAISIIIGTNLKYSAIIIMFIPCFIYFICILFKHPHKLKSTIIFFLCIIISSLIIFGLTSYVHNIVFHSNPFYTIIGDGKYDIYSPVIPKAYKSLPNIFRIFCSIFSPVSNNHYIDEIVLKIPFTITKDSLNDMILGNDIRMGGWGIFFSGIFILSIIAFIYRIIKYKKVDRSFIIITVSTFSPAFFINNLNNARYWPFLFLYSAYLIVIIDKEISDSKSLNILKYSIFFIILANSAIPALSNVYLAKKTCNAKRQYKTLSSEQKRDLYFNYSGLIYNLHDNQIFVKQKFTRQSTKPENLIPCVDYYAGSIFIDKIE